MQAIPSRSKANRGTRAGAAAVEFALVAPLFFLVLTGILEFGNAFRVQHFLSTAARQGARSATLKGSTSTLTTEKVRTNCVNNLSVKSSDVAVVVTVNGDSNIDVNQAAKGNEIGVRVSIPYSKVGMGFLGTILGNATIKSACTLERE